VKGGDLTKGRGVVTRMEEKRDEVGGGGGGLLRTTVRLKREKLKRDVFEGEKECRLRFAVS